MNKKTTKERAKELMSLYAENSELIDVRSIYDLITEIANAPDTVAPAQWNVVGKDGNVLVTTYNRSAADQYAGRGYAIVPLYTAPPADEWRVLVEELVNAIIKLVDDRYPQHMRGYDAMKQGFDRYDDIVRRAQKMIAAG